MQMYNSTMTGFHNKQLRGALCFGIQIIFTLPQKCVSSWELFVVNILYVQMFIIVKVILFFDKDILHLLSWSLATYSMEINSNFSTCKIYDLKEITFIICPDLSIII